LKTLSASPPPPSSSSWLSSWLGAFARDTKIKIKTPAPHCPACLVSQHTRYFRLGLSDVMRPGRKRFDSIRGIFMRWRCHQRVVRSVIPVSITNVSPSAPIYKEPWNSPIFLQLRSSLYCYSSVQDALESICSQPDTLRPGRSFTTKSFITLYDPNLRSPLQILIIQNGSIRIQTSFGRRRFERNHHFCCTHRVSFSLLN